MTDSSSPNATPPSAPPSGLAAHLWPSYHQRLAQWGEKRKDAIKRVWQGVGSPRNAIKFQCLECAGECVEAITDCSDRFCPLWKFRPFQTKTTTKG